MSPAETISPTAHYTGYVWARNGLSHRELETIEGRILFESLRPAMTVSGALGAPSLERHLLTRHRAIDALLGRAIEEHGITQVIEVASGLSPRGWRFTSRYRDGLVYVEGDLPGMAQRKRDALRRMGSLSERHRVQELDALRGNGPDSIAAVAGELDPDAGLAIITEGLLVYLDGDSVAGMWQRFARTLSGFRSGIYISDLHLGQLQTPASRGFRVLLSGFVRGRVHTHFSTPADAEAALRAAGFSSANIHRAADLVPPSRQPASQLTHIIEASTR